MKLENQRLQNQFQIPGCLYVFIHILEKLFRGYTGIDLCSGYIVVAEHSTNGFNGYTLFKRDQTGKRMSPGVDTNRQNGSQRNAANKT